MKVARTVDSFCIIPLGINASLFKSVIIFGELLYVCFVYLILLLGKASFVLIKCLVILKVIYFVYLSVELFLIHFESFLVSHLSLPLAELIFSILWWD